MKRGLSVFIFLVLVLSLSLSLVSASWFSEVWGKITGNAVVTQTDEAALSNFLDVGSPQNKIFNVNRVLDGIRIENRSWSIGISKLMIYSPEGNLGPYTCKYRCPISNLTWEFSKRNVTRVTLTWTDSSHSAKAKLWGIVKTDTEVPEPTPEGTCTDSDGNNNYYAKGTASGIYSPDWSNAGQYGSVEDKCHIGSSVDNQTLEEQNCYNNKIGIPALYICPNGCENGACKPIACTESGCRLTNEDYLGEITLNGIKYTFELMSATTSEATIKVTEGDQPPIMTQLIEERDAIKVGDLLMRLKSADNNNLGFSAELDQIGIPVEDVNRCELINDEIIDRMAEIETFAAQGGWEYRIVKREGERAKRSDYIVIPGHLLRVQQITNQTVSYDGDSVKFADVLTDMTYDTTITREGYGTIVIGGIEYQVWYYGDAAMPSDSKQVMLDFPQTDASLRMTFNNCQITECGQRGHKCTDRVRGCGHYTSYEQYSCGSEESICCRQIPYCGDGVCFEHNLEGYRETETSCPQDCMRCADSDNGKDYYVGGTTVGKEYPSSSIINRTDHCFNSTNYSIPRCSGWDCYLNEYYCDLEGDDDKQLSANSIQTNKGCIDGAKVRVEPFENNVCQNLINKLANPSDLTIYGKKYSFGWDNNYSGSWWMDKKEYRYHEYSASWWASWDEEMGEGQNRWNNLNIYPRVLVFEDASINLTDWFKQEMSSQVCVLESYWDSQNDREGFYYICNWDILRDNQNSDGYQYKSRQIIWTNKNVVVTINTYLGKSLTEHESKRINEKRLLEFVNSLKNNEREYVSWDDFSLDNAQDFVRSIINDCGSDLTKQVREGTNETCWPSWSCKIEPVICPPHGYQTKTCVDYGCGQPKKDEQIYCNPGMCSGCYVPRWAGSDDNSCIPYGFRFEQQTNWRLEEVFVDDQNEESLTVEEALGYNSDVGLEVYANNTALLTLPIGQGRYANITLEPGRVYNWSELTEQQGDDRIQYTLYVDEINYNSDDYNQSYIKVTMRATGWQQRQVGDTINAYCDMDGQVKEQRVTDSGKTAGCQNNYECYSNLCSGGKCVDMQEVARNSGLITRILCRISSFLGIESYDSCISGGNTEESTPSSGGGGGGGSGTTSSPSN